MKIEVTFGEIRDKYNKWAEFCRLKGYYECGITNGTLRTHESVWLTEAEAIECGILVAPAARKEALGKTVKLPSLTFESFEIVSLGKVKITNSNGEKMTVDIETVLAISDEIRGRLS